MCHARVSRWRDSAIAGLGGSVPTWKANAARLVGGHRVGKLQFRGSRSRCAAMTGAVRPKALPSRGQDLSYWSVEHDGDALALLLQREAPRGQSRCVCADALAAHVC